MLVYTLADERAVKMAVEKAVKTVAQSDTMVAEKAEKKDVCSGKRWVGEMVVLKAGT